MAIFGFLEDKIVNFGLIDFYIFGDMDFKFVMNIINIDI